MSVLEKNQRRKKRHRRVRKKIHGTSDRPRLCVFKSLNHIYVQMINDEEGHTLVAVSSLSPELKSFQGTKTEVAREVGKLVGKKALENNLEKAVYDRGGYLYHGRVKTLAEGARESGLVF
ncbi:MAG TPA: 50S ribosomal protein L18 [Atribacteraceae bacterium]|nr:50S ribosomal protein L18 [Atribacteraceae bacterium]